MVRLASFPEWKPRVQCVAETHPVDWVVLSCGYVPVNGLVDELADLGDKVVVVGDAIKCRDAEDAGNEGFDAGYNA